MEDLLSNPDSGWIPFAPGHYSPIGAGGSKVFLNRLLERALVPTLWTSNSARKTCPTVLRRMTFALELPRPTRRTPGANMEPGAGAPRHRSDGGGWPIPCKGVRRGPGSCFRGHCCSELLRRRPRRGPPGSAEPVQSYFGREPPADQGAPERFDPALIRADVDPVKFAERLEKTGGRHFSLCLQGPPGTGKSAFVRYLAERLGLQVTQKRASDLMSMWVGQTEQQIAEAFAEARAEGSILVFDEADSLLADRRGAVRSWEVSQVNEMLTWMESHPLPFACTTNFGENLDPATLRRFTFKIALDYLTAGQSEGGVSHLFRDRSSGGSGKSCQPDPGGFRGGAQESGDPRASGGCEGPRAIAGSGVRGKAGPPEEDRVSVVNSSTVRRNGAEKNSKPAD